MSLHTKPPHTSIHSLTHTLLLASGMSCRNVTTRSAAASWECRRPLAGTWKEWRASANTSARGPEGVSVPSRSSAVFFCVGCGTGERWVFCCVGRGGCPLQISPSRRTTLTARNSHAAASGVRPTRDRSWPRHGAADCALRRQDGGDWPAQRHWPQQEQLSSSHNGRKRGQPASDKTASLLTWLSILRRTWLERHQCCGVQFCAAKLHEKSTEGAKSQMPKIHLFLIPEVRVFPNLVQDIKIALCHPKLPVQF